jgi:Protein of unknown function (DUF3551)
MRGCSALVAESEYGALEATIRHLLIVAGFLVVTIGIGTSAQAQNYPWCARYSGNGLGGASNCGFVSFGQCMATVSGIGGFCEPNTLYVPSVPSHRRR